MVAATQAPSYSGVGTSPFHRRGNRVSSPVGAQLFKAVNDRGLPAIDGITAAQVPRPVTKEPTHIGGAKSAISSAIPVGKGCLFFFLLFFFFFFFSCNRPSSPTNEGISSPPGRAR